MGKIDVKYKNINLDIIGVHLLVQERENNTRYGKLKEAEIPNSVKEYFDKIDSELHD